MEIFLGGFLLLRLGLWHHSLLICLGFSSVGEEIVFVSATVPQA